MDPKKQLNILIADLLEARNLGFSRIVDLMEETNNVYLAKAWKWLRDNNKWPSKRSGKMSLWTNERKIVWGWNVISKYMTLKDAEESGPTNLPYEIHERCYRGRCFCAKEHRSTEKGAIESAVGSIAKIFERDARYEKMTKEAEERQKQLEQAEKEKES